jgi:protein-S-isoprenylcysteine O-methyltransferase Ste14
MNVDTLLIAGMWVVLIGYWAVSAIGVKPTIRARGRWKEAGLRLGIVVLVALALRNPAVRQSLRHVHAYAANSVPLGILGVGLCALGIGFAMWARVCLGRNWGTPMSRKENPELVTTGPYAFVRHPIYAGIFLAMLGSMIGVSPFWVVPFVLFGIYFLYSATREEKLMLEQFPQEYAAYRRRTKMLAPFVL